MERDFLGLNLKDSVVVVKEEAVEGCKDSAFSGSGVQWPLSNKVSALPHFMSFKAQEEKMVKSVSDLHTSSGYMGISADGFDNTRKHPLGEMQKVHHGQSGTHFSMTNYPVQPNALSMHLSHEMKVLPAVNQPISVSMGSPFFKPHFTGAGQNFSGATMKQQLLGGISATAPHSGLPSLGSAAETTEPWFSSKSSTTPTQLTIFYGGTVNVFDDISPEKAQAIMFLAGNGSTTASNMAQPRTQVQVPASKQAGGDGFLVNHPSNAPPGSGFSSPMSVSSHPVGLSGNGCPTNDEVMAVKPIGVPSTPLSQADTKAVTSLGPLAATTMIPSAVPQARKASLARFLEKRKERSMSSAPYLSKQSPECFTPVSNGAFSP
ncbi:protein TIFY 6B-like isoform X2 [Actinidia eriantha]|uniref:protein TIFY 6B-like isoform X2 n=1 Tax=Actinidia eriantha TaxID=165200 RepID=UPI00258287C6|nr:protein TIFY 6B-like isoform X2 [Actinidia eriantha]